MWRYEGGKKERNPFQREKPSRAQPEEPVLRLANTNIVEYLRQMFQLTWKKEIMNREFEILSANVCGCDVVVRRQIENNGKKMLHYYDRVDESVDMVKVLNNVTARFGMAITYQHYPLSQVMKYRYMEKALEITTPGNRICLRYRGGNVDYSWCPCPEIFNRIEHDIGYVVGYAQNNRCGVLAYTAGMLLDAYILEIIAKIPTLVEPVKTSVDVVCQEIAAQPIDVLLDTIRGVEDLVHDCENCVTVGSACCSDDISAYLISSMPRGVTTLHLKTNKRVVMDLFREDIPVKVKAERVFINCIGATLTNKGCYLHYRKEAKARKMRIVLPQALITQIEREWRMKCEYWAIQDDERPLPIRSELRAVDMKNFMWQEIMRRAIAWDVGHIGVLKGKVKIDFRSVIVFTIYRCEEYNVLADVYWSYPDFVGDFFSSAVAKLVLLDAMYDVKDEGIFLATEGRSLQKMMRAIQKVKEMRRSLTCPRYDCEYQDMRVAVGGWMAAVVCEDEWDEEKMIQMLATHDLRLRKECHDHGCMCEYARYSEKG